MLGDGLPPWYLRLLDEVASEIGPTIINTIRKMGLPKIAGGAADAEETAAPAEGTSAHALLARASCGQVRNALLFDYAMHDDIIQELRVSIWNASLRGALPEDAEHARRWIFLVLIRTTQRHATARARDLFRRAESKTAEAALEHVADPRDPETALGAHRQAERLRGLIGELSERDQRILAAKLEKRYPELAAELGVEENALRTRACRICAALREGLRDDDEDGDD